MAGCWLGECHYITQGNYYALSVMHLTRKLLEQIGINPRRLRLEWVSASQGSRFAELMTDFPRQLSEFGPLRTGEGIDEKGLKIKLEAATRLIPYIKVLERKRFNVHFETEEEYDKFFSSNEFNKLFRELIADKLVMGEIMLLLRESSQSAKEISEVLGLSLSEVSKQLNGATRQGLVTFDDERQRFAPAKVAEPAKA